MIHSFTFKNFCSFEDEAVISFEDIRKGIDTNNTMFFNSSTGSHISKVMTVIGPNASGKTNALKALTFLSWFVCNSFVGIEGDENIPVDIFAFSDKKNSIAEFELVFDHSNTIYKYILHLCKTHVVKEELYRKEETNRFNYFFKRTWNAKASRSDIIQSINLNVDVVKEILRKNVSLIAASVAIKNDTLTDIAGFWKNIISNVNRSGKSWDTASLGDNQLLEATEAYNKNQNLFNKVVQSLKDIDVGLDNIKIEERDISDAKTGESRKVYLPYGIHTVNGKNHLLPFYFESSGTKNMFVLLHFLLPAIEQGGVAVIDELEIDLHPHAIPPLIELFANPATNPKNSQLLFTSHSLEILNHLEKEQITLVEKKRGCKSEMYRLDDVKGVRRDDNIYAKYMAGAYGAVPNI